MDTSGKIPNENPFKVPEGYFDEVNKKIISATTGTGMSAKRDPIYRKIRPFLLAAASVTGFILLSYTAFRLISYHRIESTEYEVMTEEFYSPLLDDLDIYSLEENAADLLVQKASPDRDKSEIVDYLLHENIDINEIYDQL